MSEQRLDRIEGSIDRLTGKIDDMAVVVTALARIEEKHVAVASRLSTLMRLIILTWLLQAIRIRPLLVNGLT